MSFRVTRPDLPDSQNIECGKVIPKFRINDIVIYKITGIIKDQPVVITFNSLNNMSTVSMNDVGSVINHGMCKVDEGMVQVFPAYWVPSE